MSGEGYAFGRGNHAGEVDVTLAFDQLDVPVLVFEMMDTSTGTSATMKVRPTRREAWLMMRHLLRTLLTYKPIPPEGYEVRDG